MENARFNLKVVGDDILELYKDDFKFKVFSSNNYHRLSLLFLFTLLTLLCIIGMFSNKEYFFLAILFVFGAGYQIIEILRAYWESNKKKNEVEKWVDSIKNYKTHLLVIGDKQFKYYRDNEIYTYEIEKIKRTYHNDTHFYLLLLDGTDILIPRKAFDDGKYQEFTDIIDQMTKI